MKYKVLKDCVVNRAPTKSGTIVELEIDEAKALMSIGRVMPYDEPKMEDRSVGLSDDKPVKRKKKKAD